MAKRIVWRDLEKRAGLFTKRNTAMIDLDNGSTIQRYGANTKINLVQETTVNDVRYLRTQTAATQCLNWAFKASDFELPAELASLEPSRKPLNNKFSPTLNSDLTKQKSSKIAEVPKSEGDISEDRKNSILSAFRRFFRRKK